MERTPSPLSQRGLELAIRSLGRELPGVAPALAVVAILLCLLVPLPTVLVDLLLSLSLAAAVTLLVASLRVRRAGEFLVFPTLVLLLTFARVALNVSTTRLILADADAGRVVDAFANLIVRGDLVIGAVMFGILTAIQVLVIARGAERVAEVAARFTLDGMPGQQQAIDADLRAGSISPREAQLRRTALSERSDLFGRMDGVMRWVKGDAMVGLVITGINLVGGVAIGATRNGLGLADSLLLYGKLAIGDGLLAQLPALLVALAAALLVARVDRSREQVSADWLEPSTLLVPAVLLGLLALVPGMPALAFATTAVGLIAAALWLASQRSGDRPLESSIRVRIGGAQPSPAELGRALAGLRRRCEDALAIAIPPLILDATGPSLARGELELRHGDRVLGRSHVGAEPGLDEIDAILLATFQTLMRNAASLVSLDQIEAEIDRCRTRHPELVHQALRKLEPADMLAIVRAFVRERVPAPSVEALLRTLGERRVFGDLAERSRWAEHAREALADYWVRDLCDGIAELGAPCWMRASLDLEDLAVSRFVVNDGLGLVALPIAARALIEARIRTIAGERPAIVVCSAHARAALACALIQTRPHVPVLSLAELVAADVDLPSTELLDVAF